MYRILIVEDEELLRNELTLCMDWADMGFCPPELARDGSQGLAMALTRPPDVVLTDVRMPRMDGLSMIREMCKSLRCLYIVLSGYDDFSYAVEALHYGVMDYLLKPVDERQLETVLRGAAARLAETPDAGKAETAAGGPVPPGFEASGSVSGELYLQKACEYLAEHYAEDIGLGDLAGRLYISESYLSRLFVRHYRLKYTDYLNQLRIRNAIPLLRDPKWRIYQIAQMVGYNGQQYFCNVFKRMMGISPYQFRHSVGIAGKDDCE